MYAAQDSKYVVVIKLQGVLLTGLLYSPPHVRRRNEEV
jgi:hypothetical protein